MKKLRLNVLLLSILYASSVYGQDKDRNLTFTVSGISFEMIFVDSGTFIMGCSEERKDCYENEMPAHKVILSNFYMGQYEVTQKLWHAVMKITARQQQGLVHFAPTFGEGDDLPMYYINYNDCAVFCAKLNKLLSNQLPKGYKFCISTEAQWEYATRGSNKSKGYKYSGSNNIEDVSWYSENSGDKTHEVGTKAANELGIYDMSGNIAEWCRDGGYDYFNTPATNPIYPKKDLIYVLRGGSFSHSMTSSRVYNRRSTNGTTHYGNIGLRLCLSQY